MFTETTSVQKRKVREVVIILFQINFALKCERSAFSLHEINNPNTVYLTQKFAKYWIEKSYYIIFAEQQRLPRNDT